MKLGSDFRAFSRWPRALGRSKWAISTRACVSWARGESGPRAIPWAAFSRAAVLRVCTRSIWARGGGGRGRPDAPHGGGPLPPPEEPLSFFQGVALETYPAQDGEGGQVPGVSG